MKSMLVWAVVLLAPVLSLQPDHLAPPPPPDGDPCKHGDDMCTKTGPEPNEGSYCKYWDEHSLCHITNVPCHCTPKDPAQDEGACFKGDEHCKRLNDQDSYCEWWQEYSVCAGKNQPCDCESGVPEPSDTDNCAKGHGMCEKQMEGSYCKYDQAKPVCAFTNKPCDCGPQPTPKPTPPTPHPTPPTPSPTNPTPSPTNPTPSPTNPTPSPTNPTPSPTLPTPKPTAPTPSPTHPFCVVPDLKKDAAWGGDGCTSGAAIQLDGTCTLTVAQGCACEDIAEGQSESFECKPDDGPKGGAKWDPKVPKCKKTPKPTPSPTNPTPKPTAPTPSPTNPTPSPTNPTPSPTNPTPSPTAPTPRPTPPTPSPTKPKPPPPPPKCGVPDLGPDATWSGETGCVAGEKVDINTECTVNVNDGFTCDGVAGGASETVKCEEDKGPAGDTKWSKPLKCKKDKKMTSQLA